MGALLLPAAVVERGEGQRLAREELAKRIYGESEPGLLELLWQRAGEWLSAVEVQAPGGWWTLGPLLAVLAALLVALLVYLRPARSARRRASPIDTAAPLTAADHRAAAERHAEQADYGAAIRERLRALTRELEEGAVITPRPGRTATELAAESARVLPQLRDRLDAAAATFNDSAYGRRPGTADGYRVLADLDERIRRSRPEAAAGAAPAPGGVR
ncbi:DUF4129 domain-containing protein [Streptomonospora salina]|uniref:Protein-glutamine gamma-glutamyltransferase-like C-terminal domain-containing protein n=1 Tax=Streptomonospora salina TaxID=104205 RepID=A0A841E1I8_9ACTN|nr:DUF4129 domain-containing protein [Streptomonospora salina]MBB5997657.1 hypothetical protein [Streptomonospora salina]